MVVADPGTKIIAFAPRLMNSSIQLSKHQPPNISKVSTRIHMQRSMATGLLFIATLAPRSTKSHIELGGDENQTVDFIRTPPQELDHQIAESVHLSLRLHGNEEMLG